MSQLGGPDPVALVAELSARREEVLTVRARMDALLTAVLAVSLDLELTGTLRRIVTAGKELVGARYGAISVLGDDGATAEFVVDGTDGAASGPPAPGSGVPLRARGVVLGWLYLTGKAGGGRFTEDDDRVIVALAAAAGIAVDNALLYQQVRARQRWLEATGEISAQLLGGARPGEVLRLIANRAAELAGAENALIALPEPDGEALVVAVCAGQDADALTGRRIPIGESTSGAVLADHVPRSVPRLAEGVAGGLGLGPALVVLLRSGESTAGVLLAIRPAGAAAFDEHELQVVASFADQAALALRDAERQSARHELALVVDRDRIARDLHDHVIQRLFAVGLAMQATRRGAGSPAVTARLVQHIRQLQEVVDEIRGAIFDLHTDVGAGGGLREKLHRAISDATGDSGIRTTTHLSGSLDSVPAELADHAEAVVREAVSNVVRHARATELAVTVTADGGLAVEVADTGIGIPDAVTRSGLRNLERRAAEAHGSFRAERRAEGGTRLVWTVPLPGPRC